MPAEAGGTRAGSPEELSSKDAPSHREDLPPCLSLGDLPFVFIICCYHVPYPSKHPETKPKMVIFPEKKPFPTAEETVPYLNPRPQTRSPTCLQALLPEPGVFWTLQLMLSLVKRQETQVWHRSFNICRNFSLGEPQIFRSVEKSSSPVCAHLLRRTWAVCQPFLNLLLVPSGKAAQAKPEDTRADLKLLQALPLVGKSADSDY